MDKSKDNIRDELKDNSNKKNATDKDTLRILDLIIKGVLGITISALIGIYGIKSNKRQTEVAEANRTKQAEIAEANRKAQVLVQTMNHRETAASEMRANMFNTLMQHYFKEKDDEETQITILELIGLNFQDHLHLKPLFERLDSRVIEKNKLRQRLRKAANRIKRSEIDKIVGNGGEIFELELLLNQKCTLEDYTIINLTLIEIQDAYIRVTSDIEKDPDGFEVNYYDMPFSDNTTLGELVYSILLCKIDKENKRAKIKIVILPEHYFSSRNNLRFDAMIGDLLLENMSK